MVYKRITIIGLGLIGASLALAIKEKRLSEEVRGVSRRRCTIRRANISGIVDKATLNLKKGVKGADLVILAAPVVTNIKIAEDIAPLLEEDTTLIDVGSTKKEIAVQIESILPKGVYFIGCHPLAGSEHSGIEYADKDLFKGAVCILTKTRHTEPKILNKVKRFWQRLGMRTEIMNSERHDRVISKLSHLPHAVSVALVNTCGKKDLHLAAGGFKDTTRIASGSPQIWKDIFVTNRKNIIRGIRVFKKELSRIESALRDKNSLQLLKLLKKAKSIRDSI